MDVAGATQRESAYPECNLCAAMNGRSFALLLYAAMCALAPRGLRCAGQPFALDAIEGAPQRPGHAVGGLQCLFPDTGAGVAQLFFELVDPDTGMMHVRRLMDREIGAGLRIGAVFFLETARLCAGNARHLGFICVESGQRLRG